MINLAGITGIPFLKKSRFTGSEHHMNYMLEKYSEEEETYLQATVWRLRIVMIRHWRK